MAQRTPRRPPVAAKISISRSVERAIRKIQAYYADGLARPGETRDRGGRVKYGSLRAPPESDSKKWASEQQKLRRARAFAATYSPTQLKHLCQLCREHDRTLGLTLIDRLVRVPAEVREALQERVIAENWSSRQLDAEIYRKWHRWRDGVGRPWKKLRGFAQARYDLYRLCNMWRRWYKAMQAIRSSDHPKPLGKLPETLREAFRETVEQIEELRIQLKGQLKSKKPKNAEAGAGRTGAKGRQSPRTSRR